MAKTEKEREVSGVKENKNASMWVPDMDGDSTTGLDHNEVLMAKFAMDRLSGKKSLKEQMGKFFWPACLMIAVFVALGAAVGYYFIGM